MGNQLCKILEQSNTHNLPKLESEHGQNSLVHMVHTYLIYNFLLIFSFMLGQLMDYVWELISNWNLQSVGLFDKSLHCCVIFMYPSMGQLYKEYEQQGQRLMEDCTKTIYNTKD